MATIRRPPIQAVYWLLTIPHYAFVPYLPPGVEYIKGQLEQGGEGGYLHWQLLVVLSRKGTLRTMQNLFGERGHYEKSRSDRADEYVWKEETRVAGTQFELGIKPVRVNNKLDWGRVWELAKVGCFEQIPENVRVSHYRTLRIIRSDYSQPVGMERSCEVFWGKTGAGKSFRAWNEAGVDAYPKDPRTKWWDGYTGQQHVVIDEFRGAIDISHMLRWLDRYPVLVEIKGSSVPLKATKIWITSNISPRDWYPLVDQETFEAFSRRIRVTHFDSL